MAKRLPSTLPPPPFPPTYFFRHLKNMSSSSTHVRLPSLPAAISVTSILERRPLDGGTDRHGLLRPSLDCSPSVGPDTKCVFCMNSCTASDGRPQLLRCLHTICLVCLVEQLAKTVKQESIEVEEGNQANMELFCHCKTCCSRPLGIGYQ